MGKAKKRCGDEEGYGGSGGDVQTECPLPKLVLKVGGKEKKPKIDVDMIPSEILRDLDDPVHSSHHKKKKKKHKHKSDTPTAEKKNKNKRQSDCHSNNITVNNITDTLGDAPPAKKVTRPPPREEYKKPVLSPLALCLESLHRNLQRKDVYGIFTFPVTDAIAPGYSKIIKQPMDFLLMSKKINNNEYASLDEFRNDFVVMCNNAMLYNGSDTIYYKSAEKMLSLGLKMLAKDKLFKLNKSIRVTVGSEDDEDDIVTVDEVEEITPTVTAATTLIEGSVTEVKTDIEQPPARKRDRSGSASLLGSVIASARNVREQLLKKHPGQMYGYLSRNQESGETSLNILNPDTCGTNRKVAVKISKKLEQGISPGEAILKEDKKNKVIPVNYLMYGPYGSFGPAYDSSLSNMTKEESDMLLVSYGSELGVEYVRSLMNFTSNAPQVREYVDGVLNVLTHGKHAKTNLSANTRVSQTTQGGKDSAGVKGLEDEVDIDSLLTLDGAGIDITFLKDMLKSQPQQQQKTAGIQQPSKTSTTKSEKTPVTPEERKLLKPEEAAANQSEHASNGQKTVLSGKLLENAAMLESLKQCQEKRLGNRYGGTLPVPDEEMKMAHSISGNICQLMKMVPPGGVVSEEGVRKAIGSGNSTIHAADTEQTQNNNDNNNNSKNCDNNGTNSSSTNDNHNDDTNHQSSSSTTPITENSNDNNNSSGNCSSIDSIDCSGQKTEASTITTTDSTNESLQPSSDAMQGLPVANKTNGPFVIGNG